MRKRMNLAAAVVALLAMAGPLAAQTGADKPTAEMMAPVNALVKAFNSEQAKTPEVFTEDCVVLDEFGPFTWHGKQAVDAWYQALAKTMQDPKDGHWRVKTFGRKSLIAADDRAYFVVSSELDYKKDGKARVQKAEWLMVVAKSGSGWKIAGHAWAITSDVPLEAAHQK